MSCCLSQDMNKHIAACYFPQKWNKWFHLSKERRDTKQWNTIILLKAKVKICAREQWPIESKVIYRFCIEAISCLSCPEAPSLPQFHSLVPNAILQNLAGMAKWRILNSEVVRVTHSIQNAQHLTFLISWNWLNWSNESFKDPIFNCFGEDDLFESTTWVAISI